MYKQEKMNLKMNTVDIKGIKPNHFWLGVKHPSKRHLIKLWKHTHNLSLRAA